MKTLQTYIQENFKISRKINYHKPDVLERLLNMLGYEDGYDEYTGAATYILQWVRQNDVKDFEIYTTIYTYELISKEWDGVYKSSYKVLNPEDYTKFASNQDPVNHDYYDKNTDTGVFTNSSILLYSSQNNEITFTVKKTR